MVSLVDPYYDLSLEAPWNALLSLSLDALVLKVNVTKGIVYLTYETAIDLGFIAITGIGLVYQKAHTDPQTRVTTPSSVQISLNCSFLGQSYGGDNPLAWDPMNDPAPAVPGKASAFELNYLGLGQHVSPQIGDEATMLAIIEAMQKAMVPADGTTNPAQLPGIVFAADSQWLVAARFSIIGTVELIAIFNDPNLYGIRIGLSGEKAGFFAGLEFEILYKKVTPTIGLYHIELTLPDAIRQLEFGEVSITLPVVVLDIYTNGNFRVDLGFPKGLDFSRSFCVEVFPFVGYGGFYFALLTGATSHKVPLISNGTFHPVIEFGLGLSLGVGKTVDKGVFKAGLSITLIGILEGVIAWFNPDSNTVPAERYYAIQGTVALVGNLYGSVDFAVIKVDVQVTIFASIAFSVEAHMPIYIYLEAGVSVRASVKVLFFTVSFSFSMTVQASFTIGSQTPTPWNVIESGGGGGQKQLSMQATAHRALRKAALLAALPIHKVQPTMDWSPVAVSHLVRRTRSFASLNATLIAHTQQFSTRPSLTILLCPAFTQSNEQSLLNGQQGVAGGVSVQTVLLPLIQNAIPPQTNASQSTNAVVDNATEMPFIQLVSHLLAWTIQARLSSINSPSPVVTADDLRYIYQQLNSDDIEQTGFSYSNLVAFMQNNFRLIFQARPSNFAEQDTMSATIFPMLPALTLTVGSQEIDFNTHNMVDENYQQRIDAYLKQLMVDFSNSVESDYDKRTKQETNTGNGGTASSSPVSMATVIVQNYFLMIARIAVQAAIDCLNAYPYAIPAGTSPSLAQITTIFSASETEYTTIANDTLQHIADTFGVLVSTIQTVNPVVAGKTSSEPLPAGINLVLLIGALTETTTAQGDTLNSLSLRYQVPVNTLKELNPAVRSLGPNNVLPPATRLLLPVIVTPESVVVANQDKPDILRSGASMPLTGVIYQVRSDETFKTIADTFVPGSTTFLASLLNANADQPILATRYDTDFR